MLTGTFPPNFGSVFVTLSPWDERAEKGQSLDAIFASLRPRLAAIPGARAFALNPSPIRGLSRVGGFEFQLQDRAGGPLDELAKVTQRIVEEGERSPELQNLFTSFRPYVPQIEVDLDRTKAKTLGVRIDDVFETLHAFMGGVYINDFDRFGRLFRVYAQAEGDLRSKPEDVQRLWVRSERGEMVPLSTLLSLQRIAGPRDIPHYNVYAPRDPGRGVAGYSSARRSTAWGNLPRGDAAGDGRRMDRHANHERQAGNDTKIILAPSCCRFCPGGRTRAGALRSRPAGIARSRSSGRLSPVPARARHDPLLPRSASVTLIPLASKKLDPDASRQASPCKAAPAGAARGRRDPLPPVLMTALAFSRRGRR